MPGCWNVRPRRPDGGPGTSPFTVDFAFPQPEPAPVTTIAWRLAHVIVGVFGMHAASHFDGPAVSYDTFGYAATADEALGQLDQAYESWSAGVRAAPAAGRPFTTEPKSRCCAICTGGHPIGKCGGACR